MQQNERIGVRAVACSEMSVLLSVFFSVNMSPLFDNCK